MFNLHVPGTNNFAVNGGVIVHNCYDFCSYGLRSRPYATTEKDRYLVEMGAEIAAARGQRKDPYATA